MVEKLESCEPEKKAKQYKELLKYILKKLPI